MCAASALQPAAAALNSGSEPLQAQLSACLQGQVTGQAGGNTQFESFMSTYGAVKVGGRSFFRLMQNGEHVLLFPGGVKEVRHHKLVEPRSRHKHGHR